MESDLKVALVHLQKQLDNEIKRWKKEAERADDYENKWIENDALVKSLKEAFERQKNQLENERNSINHLKNENSLLNKELIRMMDEKNKLIDDVNERQGQKEIDTQRIHYLVSVKQELETKLLESKKILSTAKESEEKAQRKERAMKMQLDMQVELNREVEARLEQTLTGWKTEKEKATDNAQKVLELKAKIIEFVNQIEELKTENVKYENRLKLYDALPLPDEIRARFQDMEHDRMNMKVVITELSNHLKVTTDDLKEVAGKTNTLEKKNILLTEELLSANNVSEEREKSWKEALRELQAARLEMKSLRESCTVLHLENEDLVSSEKRLKEKLLLLSPQAKGEEFSTIAETALVMAGDFQPDNEGEGVRESGDKELMSPEELTRDAISDHDGKIQDASLVQDEGADLQDEDDDSARETARIQDRVAKSKIQRVLDSVRPDDLLPLLVEHIENESMVWRCLRSLRSLLLQSPTFHSTCIHKFLDYTAVLCMREFVSSAVVQAQALRLIATMAYQNDKVRRRLGEAGVMNSIQIAMQTHALEDTVQLHALIAITNLTHNSFENRMRFIEARGVECVVAVMQRAGDDAQLQRHACWAVLTVAGEDAASRELVTRGVPAVLANALVTHKNDAGIQQFACLAFNNLALAGNEVRRKLKVAGVLELANIAKETFRHDANVLAAAEKTIQSIELLDSFPSNC